MLATHVKHLDDRTFDAEAGQGLVVVDFYADWCGPCRMLGPVMDQLAEDLAGKAVVAKVNVDQAPAIARRFAVQAIPLVVILKDGREADRLVGVQPAAAIRQAVERAG